MDRMLIFRCIIFVGSLGLAACVNLEPQPDRTVLYTLAADVPLATPSDAGSGLFISRVELPGFLEDKRIHYRSSGGRVESVAHARWAESLGESLPRALAAHLHATGVVDVLGYYPWSPQTGEVAKLYVQFERFSGNAAGAVEVVARWQIRKGRTTLEAGRFTATPANWAGSDASTYVAALDSGIAQLARHIAEGYDAVGD